MGSATTAALITFIMEKREELLKMLEPLPGRISKLLEAGRITDSRERHCLAFMEMELRTIVASLRMLLPPPRDRCGVDLYRQKDWLGPVEYHGRRTVKSLGNLRKAMRCRCFRRPRSFDHDNPFMAYILYCLCSDYRRLELPSSELMPSPPQAAQVEAAAVHGHLVGIDSTANELLGWLMAADESLRVMAIAGPAGIGKTTLAMELHRRLRCQTHFQCHVVANFSRRPHRSKLLPQTILKQIIEQLEAPSPNSSEITILMDDPELLARNISKRLKDKRYFALIDDIFDKSDWEMINGAFPNNNCSSRILFTARDERIAGWCLSNYNGIVHKMKPLSHSDSEKLLHIKAFGTMDNCPPENLNLLCDEILTKCRGIPSFITGMADWLKQHQQQHGSSAIPRVEQVRLLLKQFEHWLSFDYRDELRQSSLYLSMFPRGYVFDKDHFVMKWLDEGLNRIQRDLILNEEICFSELVDRSIITPAAEKCGPNLDEDDLCLWQVNPFVQKFLASKAAERGLVFTSSTLTSLPSCGGNNTRIARRLALHHPDPQLPAILQQMDLSETRSLLISGAVDRTTVALDKFGYLVLLDLQGWENLKDEDLLQICKMLMLRYLSVRNTRVSKLPPQIKELRILRTLDISRTNISEIPSEVCELERLQMLDLRGTWIRHLPEKVKELIRLESLDISHTKISDLPSGVCRLPSLETLDLRGTLISQLPDQFVQIKQLRHLIVGGAGARSGMIDSDRTVLTKLPEMIHQLRILETLATIDLSEFSAKSVESLGDLHILEVLAITWSFHQCSNKAYQQALRSSIERWTKLKSLTIHCGLGCSMEFLGSLTEPPNKLEKFKIIDGKFASVPRWIRGLKQLTFLQITVCKQVAGDVKILAGLIELQRLVLGLEFIPEKAIVIEKEGFKMLERFSLDCPVPWLTFEEEAMPKLTYLRLNLHGSPASEMSVPSGINYLKKLTEVTLCYNIRYINSPNIKDMTTDAVSKEVAKHSNTIDLFINGIRKDVIRSSDKKEESATGSEVDAAEDGVQAADEAILRTTIQVQSEIEVEGETESHT
ncbi:disease resistance protein Pikm1-TS-like [Oryza glaberrima]|uniref:disease resistance protein Pikm1-TS-like n=1 Tax=Oryza glaberrima TaxID=4538 RepID=UPI00224BF29E|nr:disease resistance protein Pikm1-TS-like [Oryza glaberrima]